MEVWIKRSEESMLKNTCFLSDKFFKELQLSEEVFYNIHLGLLKEKTKIAPIKDSDELLYIPPEILEPLIPFDDIILNIWKEGFDIFLGPVVGIFDSPKILDKIIKLNGWFSVRQYNAASFSEHCLCYYFSIENIEWKDKKVRGIVYNKKENKFQYAVLPMRDVIYDKGIFLTEELKLPAKKVRKKLRRKKGVSFINSRNSLGKWELCQALEKDKDIKRYIPETIILESFNDLEQMLNRHSFIFLKSFYGSKGKEVISVHRSEGSWCLNYYDNSAKEIRNVVTDDIKELQDIISKLTEGKSFIVQQGINLLKYRNRTMDLRILIVKDDKGKWVPIFNAVRVAKGDSTITNTSTGGGVIFYEQAYEELCNTYRSVKIPDSNELYEAVNKIAVCIEESFGGFGEIGMDLGVDECGQIWILEANAKPDKCMDINFVDMHGNVFIAQILKEANQVDKAFIKQLINGEIILPHVRSIFQYAKFLTKVDPHNILDQ